MAPFMAQALYTLPEAHESMSLHQEPLESTGFIGKSFHHRSSFRLMISEFSADLPFSFGGPTFETSNIWSKTWSKGLVKPPSSLVPPLLVRTRGKGQAVLQRGRCLLQLGLKRSEKHLFFPTMGIFNPNVRSLPKSICLRQSDATSHTELVHFSEYVLLCSTYVLDTRTVSQLIFTWRVWFWKWLILNHHPRFEAIGGWYCFPRFLCLMPVKIRIQMCWCYWYWKNGRQ